MDLDSECLPINGFIASFPLVTIFSCIAVSHFIHLHCYLVHVVERTVLRSAHRCSLLILLFIYPKFVWSWN